jgi:hypothetical protein
MKTQLKGILPLVCVIAALALVSCTGSYIDMGTDTGTGTGVSTSGTGGTNPFLGNWAGTVTFGQSTAATCYITDDTHWVLGVSYGYESTSYGGTYTRFINSATLFDDGGAKIGTATVSGNTLTISITSGTYAGGSGTFTKFTQYPPAQ